jgi:hypothetical protein
MKRMMRSRLGLAAIVPAVLLTLLLAGCRSGGTSASDHPFAAYRKCLQDHGVTPHRRIDQGTTPSTDPTTAASFTAARQACAKVRPKGGLRGGQLSGQRRGAFRRCLQDHGVTLPTTTTGTGPPSSGARGGMLANINRNDPTVAAALKACRSQLVPPTSTTTRP